LRWVNLEQTGTSEADLLERLQAAARKRACSSRTRRYEAGYSPYLEVLDAPAHRQRGPSSPSCAIGRRGSLFSGLT